VRYIYGIVLKYTANTGESVFFLMVGGRRVFKFRAWCASLSLYSLFLSSRPFLPPCACAFSCSVHRHGPWFCAYRQVRNVTEDFEYIPCSMVTSLYSEPIPVTEIASDWRKFHFPRDSRVITCVNLNLASSPLACCCLYFVGGGFSIHCHSADEEGAPVPSKPLLAQGQSNRRLAR